jgi:hypothetical protein
VHGLALARSLVALEDPVVWGFVSPISVSFPTRRYTHVAVNGRVVNTDSFAPAISRAYADLLPKGRHPAVFLRLELGPGEVDVNVHPAKSAVRLRGGRSAYPLVVGTIRAALALERDGGDGAALQEGVAPLTPVGQFAGSRAHGRDAGLKGSSRHAKPSKSSFLIIQDPVCLCGLTRCSDRLSGARGGIERLSGPTGRFYAGSCISTSENAPQGNFREFTFRDCPKRVRLALQA